jgi:hypothetical protein
VAVTAATIAAANCLQSGTIGNEAREAQYCAAHLGDLRTTIERLYRDLRVCYRTYDLSQDEWKQTTEQLDQAYVAALQSLAHFDCALELLRSRALQHGTSTEDLAAPHSYLSSSARAEGADDEQELRHSLISRRGVMTMAGEYLESDLNQAAYLMARGFRFLGVRESGHGGRFLFCFEDAARSSVSDYINDGPIPARSFAAAITNLKTQLYAAKERRDNGNGNRYNRY